MINICGGRCSCSAQRCLIVRHELIYKTYWHELDCTVLQSLVADDYPPFDVLIFTKRAHRKTSPVLIYAYIHDNLDAGAQTFSAVLNLKQYVCIASMLSLESKSQMGLKYRDISTA